MTPHARARALLAAWTAPDAQQGRLRDGYLDFLDSHPDALLRDERAGHLTGSALIVDGYHVLLTLHPTVGRWLQTGGHCEPADADLLAAATREAGEESGIPALVVDPVPLRLDRHAVSCRAADGVRTSLEHLDVQFLAVAPAGAEPVITDESDDLRWWPVQELPAGVDDSVRALVAEAGRRLGWSR